MTALEGVHILVIEDDPATQALLETVLGDVGIATVPAVNGAAALAAMDRDDLDAIVLDLGLPDVAGHQLLRELRARTEVPIVVLSARLGEADRVLALEMGADDYVSKPFTPNEFVARIRVRLRRPPAQAVRSAPPASTSIVLGELEVDTAARTVSVSGRAVELTAREFDLLAHLARAPRRVFTRDELLVAVWGSAPDWQDPATVTEHVHRVRRKLGSGWIATVRGVGYRLDQR